MNATTCEQPYLSLSEVGRRLNAPGSAIRKAQKQGQLVPDFTVARVQMFKADRLPELKTILGVQTIH